MGLWGYGTMNHGSMGLWTMDYGLWTMDNGLWTMDYGLWTMDYGLWDYGPLNYETLDYGLWDYRSFSRDVITFQNLKLKIHQSFYPHQTKEVASIYIC